MRNPRCPPSEPKHVTYCRPTSDRSVWLNARGLLGCVISPGTRPNESQSRPSRWRRVTEANSSRHAWLAAVVSALMIAQQVAGKAARDALFLSSFHTAKLPVAMAGGAVLSLLAVWCLSKVMARYSPGVLSPILFL